MQEIHHEVTKDTKEEPRRKEALQELVWATIRFLHADCSAKDPSFRGCAKRRTRNPAFCLAWLPNTILKKLDSGSPLRGVRHDGASQRRDGWLQPVLADTKAYLNHPHDFRKTQKRSS